MIVTNITKVARNIWDSIPGETADRSAMLQGVIAELRRLRDAERDKDRQAKQQAREQSLAAREAISGIRRLTRPVDQIVASAVGLPLQRAFTLRVPICGVNMALNVVFLIARRPNHPLNAACAAFLTEHRLTLASAPRTGARGRIGRIIVREGDQ